MPGKLIKGTHILTNSGYIPIEDVKVNTLVMSNGTFKKVTNVTKKEFNSIIYKITADGCSEPIFCSPDNLFLTARSYVRADALKLNDVFLVKLPEEKLAYKETIDLSEYIELKKRGYGVTDTTITVGIRDAKLRSGRLLPINTTTMYFLGMYASHGMVNNNHVRFASKKGSAVHEFIVDFYRDYVNIYGDYNEPRAEFNGARDYVFFASSPLRAYLSTTFGLNLKTKTFPVEIITMPTDLKQAFLNGLFSTSDTIRTISMSLTYLVRDLAASLGQFISIVKFEKMYELTLDPEQSDRISNGHISYPILLIEKTYPRLVGYNLSIEDSDNFNLAVATNQT